MENKKRKGQYMPFNALEGYQKSLREAELEVEEVKDIEIAEDKKEELNQELFFVLENKMSANFYYLENGVKKVICEEVERLNEDTREVVFKSGKKLKISAIYEIIL